MSAEAASFGQVVRTTLGDSVYETLLEAIVTGRLAGGSELSEVELARQLNVSRTPVHEAMVRLVTDGLVVASDVRRSRTRVAAFGVDDLIEIYRMRRLLESAAAESAALEMPAAGLHALRAEADALGREVHAVDWPDRAIEFDLKFHDAIADAAGNRRLREDIRRYRRLVRGFCRMSGSERNLRDAWREHLRILEALEARQPTAAAAAMAAHVDARLQGVLGELDARRGTSPGPVERPGVVGGKAATAIDGGANGGTIAAVTR